MMMTIKNVKSQIILIHFTGKCRGATHNICYLGYKTPKEVSVVLHNGSTYDCYHSLIKINPSLASPCFFLFMLFNAKMLVPSSLKVQ